MLTELQDIIRGFDVISFDIFDTLLIRDVLKPEDIWHKMESHLGRRGFAEARKKADALTYVEATRNDCEHTFQGIYDVMGSQWAYCQDEELAFEHDSLAANPEMLELWNYAGEIGKRRILLSDMYLPRSFIEKCLNDNGISGWDAIFISSEQQCRKATGTLYQRMLGTLNLYPGQVFHIGDNGYADVEQATKNGVTSYQYQDVKRVFASSFPFTSEFLENNPSFENHLLIGSLAQAWQQYRFEHENNSYWERLGFMLGGPLAYAYVKWLGLMSSKRGITHLMFVGRDGYIWQKIAQSLFTDIKSDYFYAPRTISVQMQGVIGDNENAVKDRQRFIDDELQGKLDREKTAHDYAEYLEQFSIIPEKTALVDGISSAFSAQRMVEQTVGERVFSFYLGADNPPYYGEAFFLANGHHLGFQDFSEFIFGSPEPPVHYVTKEKVIFNESFSVFEKIKMNAAMSIANGAIACALALEKANVLMTPHAWLEYYDSFMRNLTADDLSHLGIARNSTDVNHTNYYPVITHPRPKTAIKLNVLGIPLLKVRYGWTEGNFRRTLLLLGRWKLMHRESRLYTLAKLNRANGTIEV